MSRDTIELLKECDAGISMGVASLNDVLDKVKNRKLSELLFDFKEEHEDLKNDALILLGKHHAEGKAPSAIARTMSKLKTELKLFLSEDDATVCSIINDGCHMGIKSIRNYIDKYESADKEAKQIADKIIKLEEKLSRGLEAYL